jgi:hypothetical protein
MPLYSLITHFTSLFFQIITSLLFLLTKFIFIFIFNKLKTPKLILEWIPEERRKRGRSRKTWMEGVQAAMTVRNLEQYQWKNREEWRLVCGRRR